MASPGPLSLAVGKRDTVYVSQNFAGTIDAVRKGQVTPVVTAPAPGVELGSVSAAGNKLYYTTSTGAATPEFDAHLVVRTVDGNKDDDDDDDKDEDKDKDEGTGKDVERVLADLGAHERAENPDGAVSYGFRSDLPADCLAQIPEFVPATYTGGLDSHPYATAVLRNRVLVADAGGNDILSVDRHGDVSTVAVLPPAPLQVDAAIAGALGLPECTVGETYLLESVPTDVEVGKDGTLYVTSLPGGPEGGGGPFPPLGAVYEVDPRSGAVELVARGFAGATNLAVGERGEIYVTELFGGKVSVIPRGSGTPQTFLEVPLPAAVEVEDDELYVTIEALPSDTAPPSGKVLRVELDY